MSYAKNTRVGEDSSRGEIEKMLMQAGADEFGYYTSKENIRIQFVWKGQRFQMMVPMPDQDEKQFKFSPAGRKRYTQKQSFDAYLTERKRRWRCLVKVVKAKLVAVEESVSTFEHEFLPHLITANGQTVAELLVPKLNQAIEKNHPLGLPSPGDNDPHFGPGDYAKRLVDRRKDQEGGQ